MAEVVRERRWTVDQNHHGWRLDRFLSNRIPRLSRSQVKRIVAHGGVSLDGERRAKCSTVLREGDVVVLRQHFDEPEPQDAEITVLFESDDAIVLDKPAGMLVHPTATVFRNTVVEWGRRTGRELYVVHRLDRETSGAIVFGKSSSRAGELAEAFARGDVEKEYAAIAIDAAGQFQPGESGVFDTPLGFDASSAMPTLMMGRGTLSALTRWTCVERRGDLASFQVWIEGGRQHQIRVHFALAGAPLVGDKLYVHGAEWYLAWCDGEADERVLRAPRHALHAAALTLPLDGTRQRFEAALPRLFTDVLADA